MAQAEDNPKTGTQPDAEPSAVETTGHTAEADGGYEPPVVEALGHLKDLLGKTGPGFDMSMQNARRPF